MNKPNITHRVRFIETETFVVTGKDEGGKPMYFSLSNKKLDRSETITEIDPDTIAKFITEEQACLQNVAKHKRMMRITGALAGVAFAGMLVIGDVITSSDAPIGTTLTGALVVGAVTYGIAGELMAQISGSAMKSANTTVQERIEVLQQIQAPIQTDPIA